MSTACICSELEYLVEELAKALSHIVCLFQEVRGTEMSYTGYPWELAVMWLINCLIRLNATQYGKWCDQYYGGRGPKPLKHFSKVAQNDPICGGKKEKRVFPFLENGRHHFPRSSQTTVRMVSACQFLSLSACFMSKKGLMSFSAVPRTPWLNMSHMNNANSICSTWPTMSLCYSDCNVQHS